MTKGKVSALADMIGLKQIQFVICICWIRAFWACQAHGQVNFLWSSLSSMEFGLSGVSQAQLLLGSDISIYGLILIGSNATSQGST